MNLADLFAAVNAAGIRLAAAGEHLELRGLPDAITPEIRAGAAEHKATLLSLLASAPAEPSPDVFDGQREEGQPARQGDGNATDVAATDGAAQVIGGHDWRDWRYEWLAEVGVLYLRMRDCKDEAVLARLRALAGAVPRDLSEWLALGLRIRNVENDLRLAGKLPAHHWPGAGACHGGLQAILAGAQEENPDPFAFPPPDSPAWMPAAEYREQWAGLAALEAARRSRIGPTPTANGSHSLGRVSSDAPAPPPGATIYCQDEHGRPCKPDAAHIWCWSGGPRWYYVKEHPTPARHPSG
jgi:hypothetical protein